MDEINPVRKSSLTRGIKPYNSGKNVLRDEKRSNPMARHSVFSNGVKYKPIGVIHSPFKEPEGTPIQPAGGKGINATVEVFPEYAEGLKDVEGFSHIILIYHFHLVKGSSLKAKPFMDDNLRGIFAIRGSRRPNPIGISIVKLVGIDHNILHIQDVDIVDGTPLLDIKPYVPEFDLREVEKVGWLAKNVSKLSTSKDDGRFTK